MPFQFFGRLRVRPSKTRLDPWFVRFKKARCDAGSPASTCGFLIPASGAFALFSPEEPQDARRSRETGCDLSLPYPRAAAGRSVLSCVVSQLAPARQPVSLRQAGFPWLSSSCPDFPELPGRRRPRNAVPFALAALNAPGRAPAARGHWQAPCCTDACQWTLYR